MTKISSRFVFQYFRLKIIIFCFFLVHQNSIILSQELPLGYISYFSDKCHNNNFFKSWNTDKPENWNIISQKNGPVLRGISEDSLLICYVPGTRGILSNLIFGDFILEFEFKTAAKQKSDSSGFFFLGPVKTSYDYYAIAFSADSLIFYFVEDSITNKIAVKPALLNKGEWNKVRIKRNILNRELRIKINKNSEDITFTDRKLVMGYIGFGTHDATSYLKNINVWAPTSIIDTTFHW
jgi:hypothetical protein